MSLDNILLIPGLGGGATPPAFSPTDIASLLWWYDPSDLSTLFQDSAGTTPVTADGDPVGRVLDKSGNGYHRIQPTSGSRLTYRTSGGLHWLEYGGVDDGMYTAATVDHSVSDEVTICSGVEFGVDSTTEIFIENSSNSGSAPGKFAFFNATGGVRNWRSTGTNAVTISNTVAPSKIVQTGLAKISTDLCKLRQDGAEVATSSSDQGSGNYGNEVIYFGRRNNATLPFSGSEYQSCGFTTVLSGTDLSNIESFVANKTGVSL